MCGFLYRTSLDMPIKHLKFELNVEREKERQSVDDAEGSE